MNIAYYITGHGYGHSIRSIEIIKSILKMTNGTIYLRTCTPEWIFDSLIEQNVYYQHVELEAGIRQKTSFNVDKLKTCDKCFEILNRKDQLIKKEISFLKSKKIDIAISDITPLAFDACAMTDIPCYAVGNFSWDWIYSEYINEIQDFKIIIKDIQKSYQKSHRLFRLPFYGDMSVFPKIVDVPLVGRKSNSQPKEIKKQLNFDPGSIHVLLAMRTSDLNLVDFSALEIPSRYQLVVTNGFKVPGAINITDCIPFEDILNACDVVLSKPGYGIVSECIVNQKPILYIPREDFPEDRILRNGLEESSVCQLLPFKSYLKGEWQPYLDALLTKKTGWRSSNLDGEHVIAQWITKK